MNDYNVLTDMFDKQIICPVCGAHFIEKSVKSKSPRVSSKDSDFFIRYSTINPYFYDIWICNSCGYSAMKSDFENIKEYKKELIMKNITPKWKPRKYPAVLDENLAIERYKLALLSSIFIEAPNSTKAMLSLKIAWMYRLLEDVEQEKLYLKQAVDGFNKAYIYESFPMYGLQRDSLMYLIGELNRRLENDTEALQWLSKTIVNQNTTYRIKEMARNSKELIQIHN